MEHLVAMFEQSVRRMIENDGLHSDARRLLALIQKVAHREQEGRIDFPAELRLHAFMLIVKLGKQERRDLVTPYLNNLADASSLLGKTLRIANELLPVVERLTSDPFAKKDSKHPSWMPKALSPQDANP